MINCKAINLIGVNSKIDIAFKYRKLQRTISLTEILKEEIMIDDQEPDFGKNVSSEGFLDSFAKKLLHKEIEMALDNHKLKKTFITRKELLDLINDNGIFDNLVDENTEDSIDECEALKRDESNTSSSLSASSQADLSEDNTSIPEKDKNGNSNKKNVCNDVKNLGKKLERLEAKIISVQGLMESLKRANFKLLVKKKLIRHPKSQNDSKPTKEQSTGTDPKDENNSTAFKSPPGPSHCPFNKIDYYNAPVIVLQPAKTKSEENHSKNVVKEGNPSYYDELFYERRQHALNRLAYKKPEDTFKSMSPMLLSQYLKDPKKPYFVEEPVFKRPGFIKLY